MLDKEQPVSPPYFDEDAPEENDGWYEERDED